MIDVPEIKRRIPIEALALQYYRMPLKPRGREFVGLCPFHSEKTPSFYVVPKKGMAHCFGCGEGGDIFRLVELLDGVDFLEAAKRLSALAGTDLAAKANPVRPPPAPDSAAADDDRRLIRAVETWRAAQPARGTLVDVYLQSRGIDVGEIGGMPPALRFLPRLRHQDDDGRVTYWPAMVAVMSTADKRIGAVHCTYLKPDGRGKADVDRAKKMFGTTWGPQACAIRLAPPARELTIGEGIETGLSVMVDTARQGRMVGNWAAGSLINISGAGLREDHRRRRAEPHPKYGEFLPSPVPDMARPGVILPDIVREPIILEDADGQDPDAHRMIYARAAERFRREGRQPRTARPPAGFDFNDMIRGQG